jgi:cytochrome c oxidase subunit 2
MIGIARGLSLAGKFLSTFGIALSVAAVLLPGLALADAGQPRPGEMTLQPSVTPIMDSIHSLHDGLLMWIITGITLLVFVLLAVIIFRFNSKANPVPSRFTHNTLLEIVWTALPVVILVIIAIPSFAVLTDQLTVPDGARKYLGGSIFAFGGVDVPAPALTVKVTGSQWYWSYDYPDDGGKHFDSNILSEQARTAQTPQQPRLLAVDNMLIVPVGTTVRVEVTGADVIHSWSVPAFGIKMDAVPGRLNETWFNARKEGVYYGQCSQLCGKDHAFMPIAVRVISQDAFAKWIAALKAGSVDDANKTLPPLQASDVQPAA